MLLVSEHRAHPAPVSVCYFLSRWDPSQFHPKALKVVSLQARGFDLEEVGKVLSVVVHTWNPTTWEAEVGEDCYEFQANQIYLVRPCLKNKR